jgi:predicted acyl esterase
LGESVRSLPGYVADFTTPPLTEDLLLSGLPRLHVTVTPMGASGHVAAWLYDVDGETERLVGWTQMNLMFADGTEEPKQFSPNQPLLAKMEFQPLDARLGAGHQLKVRVWQYAEADRLPTLPPEAIYLNIGGNVQSTLELPIIERGPEAYFQPPMP